MIFFFPFSNDSEVRNQEAFVHSVMACHSEMKLTKVSIILFGVFLLITVEQTQGLSQFDSDCGGCWDELEATVAKLDRASTSSNYRHNTGDSVLLNSVDPRGQLRNDYVGRLFRRSAAAGSPDLVCGTCWVVVNRLRSLDSDRGDKEIMEVGPLMKKAMLNNGWL